MFVSLLIVFVLVCRQQVGGVPDEIPTSVCVRLCMDEYSPGPEMANCIKNCDKVSLKGCVGYCKEYGYTGKKLGECLQYCTYDG
ncbi:uncharacterized protein LOC143068953 isoform X2 [Mytilus galloprovincialis]|uniref:uncharacterized protein LOC143068953 isoform X2 n=1 Tax=Mytilus galloprovincialis TaxID=29158 RepID=UPI003F7C68F4